MSGGSTQANLNNGESDRNWHYKHETTTVNMHQMCRSPSGICNKQDSSQIFKNSAILASDPDFVGNPRIALNIKPLNLKLNPKGP